MSLPSAELWNDWGAFEKRFPTAESFKSFLGNIGRQDARELIFGTVLEAADSEAIEGREAELLDWLAKTWDIKIEIEDEPGMS